MDKTMILQERVSEIAKTSQKIRDFLTSVLDEKSFVETNAFLFGGQGTYLENPAKGEGVVTGYGTIGEMPVYVYAQNQEVLGAGLGKAQADKILKVLELAEKTSTPVISIIDSNGARLGEGVEALSGYARIMKKVASLSGVVPQIAIVKGRAVGQMEYIVAMNDFCFMTENAICASQSPEVLAAQAGGTVKATDIFNAKMHAEKTGICSKVATEATVRNEVISLLDMILCSGVEDTSSVVGNPGISAMNNREALKAIADGGVVLEMGEAFAPALFTSFARLGGSTVGFIGTEDAYLSGDMAKKAARFARFCELFAIPVVTLTDCKGKAACVSCEQTPEAKEIATLLYTMADTTNTKIGVITKNAVGVGFTAFASKELGFDYTIACADAFVSALPVGVGAEIVYGEEVKKASDPAKAREAINAKYAEVDGDPFNSAKNGEIDAIIDASFLRAYIMQALVTLEYKESLSQGVGNMPL